MKSGVPQGSVIGPILFLVLLSDIDKDVTSSHTSSFADDTRMLREILNAIDSIALQSDLNAVFEWSVVNNMAFNDPKFDLVRYGTNQELKDSTFYTRPDGEKIEEKCHVRDLGVTMSNTAHLLSTSTRLQTLPETCVPGFFAHSNQEVQNSC
jgi:hypothetical protein